MWLLVQGVAYSSERDELMTCAVEKQARVWDAARLGAPRLSLLGHTGIVLQVLNYSLGRVYAHLPHCLLTT